MADTKIIIFPRGQLTPKDKERLTKAGVIAVEADDPSKVVVTIPGVSVQSADDLMMAALHAVVKSDTYKTGDLFAAELYRRYLEAHP